MSPTPSNGIHHQARSPNGYAALLCAIVQQALRDAQGKGVKSSSASHPHRVHRDALRWVSGECGECRDEILAMVGDATQVRLCDADLLRVVTGVKRPSS